MQNLINPYGLISRKRIYLYRLNYIYSDITSILIFLVILGTFVVLHEIEKYEQIKYYSLKSCFIFDFFILILHASSFS